jgi:N-acetylneuraminic acid mutarotase
MKASSALVIWLLLAEVSSAQTGGGEWITFKYMPSERQELATAVLNGKIYVLAGYTDMNPPRSTRTVDVYNPPTDTWMTLNPLPGPNNHNAAAVAAGKLYSFAGLSRATYVYDPASDSWSEVARMLFGHSNTPAVGVINDKIYCAGGLAAGDAMEVFDPVTNTWTALASMKVGRHHCAGGVINGKFYVAAGRGSSAAETALEVYDPQTNNWTTLAPMPTARSGVGAAVVHDELYVMGGEGAFGVYPHIEVYNPATNSWRRIQDMQGPRHGIWPSVIGNKIWVQGGGIEANYFPSGFNDVFVVTSKATFANIATRLKVGTGDNALIGGFIVTGTASKRIVLRAVGPSLPFGGTLPNPRLELYNGAGQLIAVNTNWQEAPNKQEIIDSSVAPSHNLEAAILTTVTPGNYTAIVSGEGGSEGIALVEVYDLEAGSNSSLANISTRGFVQADPDVLIAGMIFDGQLPRKTMLRAIGPSLGRGDALPDPKLALHDANGGLVAENDNWQDAPNKQEIIDSTIPPQNIRESAIVQTLPPARYTAIVRGVNDSTGLALVEAYALE